MPIPAVVFRASLSSRRLFHTGTVTFLFYPLPALLYLSGNLRKTNAYSGKKGTLRRCRAMHVILHKGRG